MRIDVPWGTRTIPVEVEPVPGDGLRIGVFVCDCGLNIAGAVDCGAVCEYSETLEDVVLGGVVSSSGKDPSPQMKLAGSPWCQRLDDEAPPEGPVRLDQARDLPHDDGTSWANALQAQRAPGGTEGLGLEEEVQDVVTVVARRCFHGP